MSILLNGNALILTQLLGERDIPHAGSVGDSAVCFRNQRVVDFFPALLGSIVNGLRIDIHLMQTVFQKKFFGKLCSFLRNFFHNSFCGYIFFGFDLFDLVLLNSAGIRLLRQNLQGKHVDKQYDHQNHTANPQETVLHCVGPPFVFVYKYRFYTCTFLCLERP